MNLDRVAITGVYIYLTLPIVLFAAGWLKTQYAAMFLFIVFISLLQCLRNYDVFERFSGFTESAKFQYIVLMGAVAIAALWVEFSGIGGFSFQNSDHEMRNLMFHDLIDLDWPVVYDYSYLRGDGSQAVFHGALVYYIAYWLPAALIGKLWGWKAANIALYLWTVIGVLLSQYLLLRYFKRLSFFLLTLFVFWSGMDALPCILHGQFPLGSHHLEWWATYFQYSSVTTTLYWVFNQTVATWLVVFLIMNLRSKKNLFFTYSLCLPFAPFPFIGFAPFVLYKFCCDSADGIAAGKPFVMSVWTNIKQGLTFANFVGGAAVALTCGLYFISNQHNTGNSGFVSDNQDAMSVWLLYGLFCIVEFGVYALIIGEKYGRNPYFIIAVTSLFLIPLYSAGTYNDFAMRVSIPALLILMFFVAGYLLSGGIGYKKYILIVLLIIGAITPANEMIRSLKHTVFMPTEIVQDHMKTFADPQNIKDTTFFVTQNPERSIFFKYLAKNK